MNRIEAPIALTLLSGQSQWHKHQLLHEWLNQAQTQPLAVIVNDDQQLNAHFNDTANLAQVQLYHLSVGCVCCTLKAQLIQLLEQIRQTQVNHIYLDVSASADVKALLLILMALPWLQVQQVVVLIPLTSLLAERQSPLLTKQLASATQVYVLTDHALTAEQQHVIAVQQQKYASIATNWFVWPVDAFVSLLDSVVGLAQQCTTWSSEHRWSRVALKQAFAELVMPADAQLIAMLRTGPQHWYHVCWQRDTGWQWQESDYVGNSWLCANEVELLSFVTATMHRCSSV